MDEVDYHEKKPNRFLFIYRKIPRLVKTVLITILCTCLVLVVLAKAFNKDEEPNGVYVSNYLRAISELSTVEHSYTYIGEFDNSRQLDLFVTKLDIPFTNKHFIGVFNGTIKYGIDISKIKDAEIDKNKKIITINMPKVIRTSHSIDFDSVKYFNEDNNILNPISVKDSDNFKKEHMKDAEDQDIKDNVLEYVHNETEKCIKLLVTNMFEEYKDYKVYCSFPEQKTIEKGELPRF